MSCRYLRYAADAAALDSSAHFARGVFLGVGGSWIGLYWLYLLAYKALFGIYSAGLKWV